MSRDVEAHFAPLTDMEHGSQFTAVDWAPVGGGHFPKFLGFIGIKTDEDFGRCALTIEGNYDPPMGVIGAAFDVAVGRKIAKATARELLKTIRREVEDDYLARSIVTR